MPVVLVAASAACLALLVANMLYGGNATYAFLAWNLVLAAVPLGLALAIERAIRLGLRALVPLLAVLWVLFLPNSPYIVTDFVHVGTDPGVPVWSDIVLFSAFAATGLLLGLTSIHLLKGLVRPRLSPVTGRVAVAGLLAASSFGIFLGRFEQLNSWDLVSRPLTVIRVAFMEGSLAREAAFTLAFTCFLFAAYAAFESLLAAGAMARKRGPARISI
jgi:uncharacterized membrane protein